jgi:asparagine N-glycosylation enzyme membrane subunit Stt3
MFIFRVGLFAGILVLGVLARLTNFDFIVKAIPGHLYFIDTDGYYHLRRLAYFLQNFPSSLEFDLMTNWPAGGAVDWPNGFLWFVGLPLKLLGVNSALALETGASVVMIITGLFVSVLAYVWALRVFKSVGLSLLVMLLVALNVLIIRFSCLGQLDHHILEALYPLAGLIVFDQMLSSSRASWAWALLMAVLWTVGPMISSSLVFVWGAWAAVAYFVYADRINLKAFLTFASIAVLLVFAAYAFGWTRASGPFDLKHLSLFHGLVSLLCLGLCSVAFLWPQRRSVLALGGIALSVLLWLLQWPAPFYYAMKSALDYVFGKNWALQNVGEANYIFQHFEDINFSFMHLNFGYGVWLLLLAPFCLLAWRILSTPERASLVALLVLSIPGVVQKRFSQLMVVLFLIFLVGLISRLSSFVDLGRNTASARRIILSLLALMTLLPGAHYGFAPAVTPRDYVDGGTLALSLKAFDIPQDKVWARLGSSERPEGAVWTYTNLGHAMQYYTGLGVVSNSFYQSEGMLREVALRTTKDSDELLKTLQDQDFLYAVLADDFHAFDMLLRMFDVPHNRFLTNFTDAFGQNSTSIDLKELEAFAWVRWLVADVGGEPQGLSTLVTHRFDVPYFHTYVKILKIQELIQ